MKKDKLPKKQSQGFFRDVFLNYEPEYTTEETCEANSGVFEAYDSLHCTERGAIKVDPKKHKSYEGFSSLVIN